MAIVAIRAGAIAELRGSAVAGIANAIVSLWPMDDGATALFMQTLYSRPKQRQSAAQALTATKREFAVHPRFSHPFYWAPFVLVGAG